MIAFYFIICFVCGVLLGFMWGIAWLSKAVQKTIKEMQKKFKEETGDLEKHYMKGIQAAFNDGANIKLEGYILNLFKIAVRRWGVLGGFYKN